MSTIATSDIRKYVAERQEKGYANATINRELSALKRMCTLAIQAGKMLSKPHLPMLVERNVRQGSSSGRNSKRFAIVLRPRIRRS
jgi:site-specific recombinase XerD